MPPPIMPSRYRTVSDLPMKTSERLRNTYMVHEQRQTREEAADTLFPAGFSGEPKVIFQQPSLSAEPMGVTVEQCKEYLKQQPASTGCCGGKRKPDELHMTLYRALKFLEHFGGQAELKDLMAASHAEEDPAAVQFFLPCTRVVLTAEDDPAKPSEQGGGKKGAFSFFDAMPKVLVDMEDVQVSFRRDSIGIVQQSRKVLPDAGSAASCCGGICGMFMPCMPSEQGSEGCCTAAKQSTAERRARKVMLGPAAYVSEASRVFSLPRANLASVQLYAFADAYGMADTGGSCGGCCTHPKVRDIDWHKLSPLIKDAPVELGILDMPDRIITLGLQNVVPPGSAYAANLLLELHISPLVHIDAVTKIVKLLQSNVDDMRGVLFGLKYGPEAAKRAGVRRNTAWGDDSL